MECPTGMTLSLAVDEATLALGQGNRGDGKKIADFEIAQRLWKHHQYLCPVCARNLERPRVASGVPPQPMRYPLREVRTR